MQGWQLSPVIAPFRAARTARAVLTESARHDLKIMCVYACLRFRMASKRRHYSCLLLYTVRTITRIKSSQIKDSFFFLYVCEHKSCLKAQGVLFFSSIITQFIALKHIQATLYVIRFRMGSQSSLCVFRRGTRVEWW